MSRRPDPIELDRTQVRRVASAIDALRVQHGTLGDVAAAIGVKVDQLGRVWRQPAAIEVPRHVLVAVAAARGGDVEALLRGELAPLVEPAERRPHVRGPR